MADEPNLQPIFPRRATGKPVEITYTKIEVAELQLRQAIHLFFSESEPVSIETLAAAANGILRGLGSHYGIRSPIHDSDYIKPEYKSEWFALLHADANYFKHADRDPLKTHLYKTNSVHFVLAEACHLYLHLAFHKEIKRKLALEPLAFNMWLWLKYPNLRLPNPFWDNMMPPILKNLNPDDFSAVRLAIGIK